MGHRSLDLSQWFVFTNATFDLSCNRTCAPFRFTTGGQSVVRASQKRGDSKRNFAVLDGLLCVIFLRIVSDMAKHTSDDISMKFWLRAESKPHEQRTPLTPVTCKKLLSAGKCSWTLFTERAVSSGVCTFMVDLPSQYVLYKPVLLWWDFKTSYNVFPLFFLFLRLLRITVGLSNTRSYIELFANYAQGSRSSCWIYFKMLIFASQNVHQILFMY